MREQIKKLLKDEAIFSKRLSVEKDQFCIGSSDKYMAVCRKCYLE